MSRTYILVGKDKWFEGAIMLNVPFINFGVPLKIWSNIPLGKTFLA